MDKQMTGYVIVCLNGEEEQPNYFILIGAKILAEKAHYFLDP